MKVTGHIRKCGKNYNQGLLQLLLCMQIQENETTVNEQPSVSSITVELTRPTLDTLLDGMRRIRDQLSSVAGRK